MRRPLADSDILAIYHDESDSATAATVQVIVAGSVRVLQLVITGGANAGTTNFTLSDYLTVAILVAAIDVLDEGWVVRHIGSGGASDPTKLIELSATSCFGSSSEQFLRGIDTYAYENAINAASNKIEAHCGRTFASTTYRQLYSGAGRDKLRLHDFPVTAVSRVCVGRDTAMKVRNTSSDAKDATVSNDLTNVSLTIIGGANAGSDDVTISTKTVAELVTAIVAVGKGWEAESHSTKTADWPATDLFKHEAFGCLNGYVSLYAPDESEEDVRVDYASGIVRRGYGTESFFLRRHRTHYPSHIPPLVARGGSIWPDGQLNVFVAYTAGYATTPADLGMLCNELAATILRSGGHDMNVSSESMGGYSYSLTGQGWMTEHFQDRLEAWCSMAPFPEYIDV